MTDCKNILVIEDDRAIRDSLKDVLEMQGYNVMTAADGAEGLKHLGTCSRLPCLILLDLMMPGMNGWHFLDAQRANPRYSNIPIVVCSAYHESAKSIRLEAVIDKPVQLPALLGAVRNLCA